MIETNAAYKLLESRIGPEGIEARTQEDARIKSLFKTFFEPIHGLIHIPKSRIDHGNLRTVRVSGV
jgi:hypothetical protein